MDLVAIRTAINSMTTSELLLWIVLIGVFIYNGTIKLPSWIKTKKKTSDSADPHESCPHKIHLMSMIQSATNATALMIKIDRYDTVREQMNTAEAALETLESQFKKEYIKIMKANDFVLLDMVGSKDYKHYEEILGNVSLEIKEVLKLWFKENHFIERSDEDFSAYVESKLKILQGKMAEILDLKYASTQFGVSREMLSEANTEALKEIGYNQLRQMFYAVREISRVKKAQIHEIEKQMGLEDFAVNLKG